MNYLRDSVVRAEADEVVGFHADHVGEEVPPGEGEVLDDQVERLVRVLDARDGDVSDLVDNARQDNLADVQPELRLELETTLAIEEKVLRQACPVLAKPWSSRVNT